jgi:Copper type II ascorbate-dependent monooxygenase, C-terminal domain
MRAIWLVALACLALATSADAKRLHLHKPRHGFQMRMTSFVVQPGADREGCEYAVAPNRRPMDVAGFELNVTPGAHHFVLWEYLGKDQSSTDFWTGIQYAPGCVGLGPQDAFVSNANLFGMVSSATKRIRFPPGVAVRLEPHAIVYPNLHLHNYTAAPIAAQAVFNLIPARPGSVQHHAQAFTIGSWDINIPAQGTASLTGEWHAPANMNLVQISTHQHHRGTRMTVDQIDAAGNDVGELVTSPDWEHPSVTWYTTAKPIRAGEGLRFTCEWSNPDDHPVHFGVTTEDEMCFVGGYFYPDDDGATVSGPGCQPQGSGLECFVPNVATTLP